MRQDLLVNRLDLILDERSLITAIFKPDRDRSLVFCHPFALINIDKLNTPAEVEMLRYYGLADRVKSDVSRNDKRHVARDRRIFCEGSICQRLDVETEQSLEVYFRDINRLTEFIRRCNVIIQAAEITYRILFNSYRCRLAGTKMFYVSSGKLWVAKASRS